ncbi:MAG: DUF6438 domain-containing protein [Burkholderiales bacterium]
MKDKTMRFASVVLLASLGGLSCTSTNGQANRDPLVSVRVNVPDSPSIKTLPSYRLRLYEDRTVEYEGIHLVKVLGSARYKITEEQFNRVVSAFTNTGFLDLKQEFYGARTVSMERIEVSLRHGHNMKSVLFTNRGAPKEIHALWLVIVTELGAKSLRCPVIAHGREVDYCQIEEDMLRRSLAK